MSKKPARLPKTTAPTKRKSKSARLVDYQTQADAADKEILLLHNIAYYRRKGIGL